MPKFTLMVEHDSNCRTITEFVADNLDDVVFNMDTFLRGTGFVYDGELTIDNVEAFEPEDRPVCDFSSDFSSKPYFSDNIDTISIPSLDDIQLSFTNTMKS